MARDITQGRARRRRLRVGEGCAGPPRFWPADSGSRCRYQVRGPKLRADIRVVNPSTVPLPWGFGTHPYFKLPLGAKSRPTHCLVMAPTSEEWELVNCLPTGRRLPISEAKDLARAPFGCPEIRRHPHGTAGRSDVVRVRRHGRIVGKAGDATLGAGLSRGRGLHAAGRNAVCLEPYTCATDAINLQQRGIEAGWHVLEPNAEFRTWIEITASEVIA